jgi:hypothetical protein
MRYEPDERFGPEGVLKKRLVVTEDETKDEDEEARTTRPWDPSDRISYRLISLGVPERRASRRGRGFLGAVRRFSVCARGPLGLWHTEVRGPRRDGQTTPRKRP